MCPQVSKVYLGEHQALLGRRIDDANHRGTHKWLLLPKTPLQPLEASGFPFFPFPLLYLGKAGVILPKFSPSTLFNVYISCFFPRNLLKDILAPAPVGDCEGGGVLLFRAAVTEVTKWGQGNYERSDRGRQ